MAESYEIPVETPRPDGSICKRSDCICDCRGLLANGDIPIRIILQDKSSAPARSHNPKTPRVSMRALQDSGVEKARNIAISAHAKSDRAWTGVVVVVGWKILEWHCELSHREGIGKVGRWSRQNSGWERIEGVWAHKTGAAVGKPTLSNSASDRDAVGPQPPWNHLQAGYSAAGS